jgi:predicted ABC-type transport system involved in lysophospholipase L1 biosynthesis ATPase subunit
MSPAAAAEIAIRVREVTKTYGKAVPVAALRGVSLQVGRGERLALLGKSGSGKSTLLNLLGGLDVPTSGSIEVFGSDLACMRRAQLARHRLETVGMIFQAFNLVPSRTALQNVELPLVFAGRPPAERRKAAQAALEAVGLGQRLHHLPSELSGGEHQRVAIARALVNRPQILLADEPTGNLDSATAAEVLDILLAHVRQRDMTLILVTHDEELAQRCAERAVWLRDGLLA